MVSDDLEAQLLVILAEMDAGDEWTRLDRAAQTEWLQWVAGSGETPRVRMYEAASQLKLGKRTPPRLWRVRAFASVLLDGVPWR
jgi:hypothetical protein